MAIDTDPTPQTVIVRTNLPAHLKRALDLLAIDVGKSKCALLVEAVDELLASRCRSIRSPATRAGR
jgi:hypothetical protein